MKYDFITNTKCSLHWLLMKSKDNMIMVSGSLKNFNVIYIFIEGEIKYIKYEKLIFMESFFNMTFKSFISFKSVSLEKWRW